MSGPIELVLNDTNLQLVVDDITYPPVEVYDYLGNRITDDVTFKMCIISENIYFKTRLEDFTMFSCWYIMSHNERGQDPATSVTLFPMNFDDTDNSTQFLFDVVTVGVTELTTRISATLYFTISSNTLLQCYNGGLIIHCSSNEKLCLGDFFSSHTDVHNIYSNISTWYMKPRSMLQTGYCLWSDQKLSLTIFGVCLQVWCQSGIYTCNYPNVGTFVTIIATRVSYFPVFITMKVLCVTSE